MDTETTGLIKNSLQPLERQPFIIEFFGLSHVHGSEVGEFYSTFKQKLPLEKIITTITGITDEKLFDAPWFTEKATAIKDFIEQHDEIVAHNMSFDKAMIDFEMKRANLEVNWPTIICTVESTDYMKGHRLKLADLYELLFGEKFDGAHRAEVDVRALSKFFFQLREMGVV